MSHFKEIKTCQGLEFINPDNVSYLDTIAKKTRIVMNDGTVFFVDKPIDEIRDILSPELNQDIAIAFDNQEVHTKDFVHREIANQGTKNKKGGNRHGKNIKNS